MKPVLKVPGTMLLKLIYDEPLSHFAFNFNVRRYNMVEVLSANEEVTKLDAYRNSLISDTEVGPGTQCSPRHRATFNSRHECWLTWRLISVGPCSMGVPLTMEQEAECEETSKANIVTKGACLARMRARLYGRTTQGCGSDWDSLRPWDCDDVIKAHFVRERNLELGAVEVQGMRTTQDVGSENIWQGVH